MSAEVERLLRAMQRDQVPPVSYARPSRRPLLAAVVVAFVMLVLGR